ncbi:MAG: CHAT domain-containing protein [Acidobacteriia bacterium]|nr:CHAT domain-containing protein [Terriglobia bacterium]
MKRHSLVLLSCLTIFCTVAQAKAGGSPSDDPKSGVVVEAVRKNFAAEKAGLQEGDILLHWSRGGAQGEIESPFTVSAIEIEQSQLGAVTLEGFRGAEKRTWSLGPDSFGIKVRPNFSGPRLAAYQEGRELAKAGKLTEAMERWRVLASQFDRADPIALHVWLVLRTAETLSGAEEEKEAERAYNEAIQMAAGAGTAILTQLLLQRADSFYLQNQGKEAEKYYQQALEESRKSGAESLMVAAILNDLGLVARRGGGLDKAEKYYLQALAMREKLAPGSLCVAESFNNLAVVFGEQGDVGKAEDYLSRALDIRKRVLPDSLNVAGNLNNLGMIHRLRGDLMGAEKFYEEALEIRKKLAPGGRDFANSLNSLGVLAQQRGDLLKAEERYQAALAIYRKADPGSIDLANFLLNLGHLCVQRGDWDAAGKFYQQALEIRQRLAPGSLDVARNFMSLGYLADLQGDQARAEDYHQQALAIAEKLAPQSLDVAMSLDNLGMVAASRGALDKAEEYERRSLAIYQKLAPGSLDTATNLNNLGEVFERRGDLTQAEQYHSQAIEIIEKLAPGSMDHADTLAALASIARRRLQPEAATHRFEQAMAALENQLAQLGGTEESRTGFRARHNRFYKDYIDLLMEQNQPELAFQVLERSRARSLLELLAEGRVDIRKGVDPGLLNQERALRQALNARSDQRVRLLGEKHSEEQAAEIAKAISELLDRLLQVQSRIRAASPAYAALMQPQPLSARQVQQQLLDRDTLLLEYMLGEERSYVFAVRQDGIRVFRLPKREEIENAARRVYLLLAAQPAAIPEGNTPAAQRKTRIEYRQAVTQLSGMVLGPVAGELKARRLLVVSDGALAYVPFSVLQEPSNPASGSGPASPPLILNHEIVYLPSASVLAVLRQQELGRKPAPNAVAVLADPVFEETDPRVAAAAAPGRERAQTPASQPAGSGVQALESPRNAGLLTRSISDIEPGRDAALRLPRLRFSRAEADAILALSPRGSSMRAVDFDASRATAISPELSRYRIIHFATHGLLDSRHPELSGLVLSLVDQNGRPQEGFLQLQDIYNMDVPAELVVLSACETGLGREISGEGLVGLTRGFMHAGASRVVASLWKVSDLATEKLMTAFYTAMERDGMSPAAALHFAQLRIMKQKRWSSPYYWAGFQIQGEWK